MNSFHYKAAIVWNKIMPKLLDKPDLDTNTNLVIPGSCLNSDLTTPIGYIKHKTKAILLNIQCFGDPIHWLSDRLVFFKFLNYNTVLIEAALTTTQFRKPCDYTYQGSLNTIVGYTYGTV